MVKGYYFYDKSPTAHSASHGDSLRDTKVLIDTTHFRLAWLSFTRIEEENWVLCSTQQTNRKFEGNRTKWTECILYNALKFMKEAGRFARCPVRPESFRRTESRFAQRMKSFRPRIENRRKRCVNIPRF